MIQRDPNVYFEGPQTHSWISVASNYTLTIKLTVSASSGSAQHPTGTSLALKREHKEGQQWCHPYHTTHSHKSQLQWAHTRANTSLLL